MTSSFTYDEWNTPARRRRKRTSTTPKSPKLVLEATQNEFHSLAPDWLIETHKLVVNGLSAIAPPGPSNGTATRILCMCLGLGSPTTSLNARLQLVLLLYLSDRLNIPRSQVYIYDPVFTQDDKLLLFDLCGLSPAAATTENQVPPRESYHSFITGGQDKDSTTTTTTTTTLLFMPHCDLSLYEQILQESSDNLQNILFICNPFQEYLDSNPTSALLAKAPSLLKTAPLMESWSLTPLPQWPTAFNSTAVQFVKPTLEIHRDISEA